MQRPPSFMLNDYDIPRHVDGYQVEEFGDAWRLSSPEQPSAFCLTEMSAQIWRLCNGRQNIQAIRTLLQEASPQTANQITRDLRIVLTFFISVGALELTRLPGVSCMCITYGRVHLLEEAIECFLRQDYPGPKELVILNDFAAQELECTAPGVVVINVPHRFRTLGEKRNACAALCTYDILFVWDDDDISLPHRISLSVDNLGETDRCVKPTMYFHWDNGELYGPLTGFCGQQSCWTRGAFESVKGYTAMNTGEDRDLARAFSDRGLFIEIAIPPEATCYIYRWGGTHSPHISGYGEDEAGKASGYDMIAQSIQGQLEAQEIPRGKILLNPRWEQDYSVRVKEFLAQDTESK